MLDIKMITVISTDFLNLLFIISIFFILIHCKSSCELYLNSNFLEFVLSELEFVYFFILTFKKG